MDRRVPRTVDQVKEEIYKALRKKGYDVEYVQPKPGYDLCLEVKCSDTYGGDVTYAVTIHQVETE